ncbi:MAG: hypothetical protein ACE5EM_01380, partial [Sphingomonadales bacterium]
MADPGTEEGLSADVVRVVSEQDMPQAVRELDDGDPLADGILMAHQVAWIADESELKVNEKGRRTGITYCEALDDTITAATRRSDGGDNVFYIGDTRDK